MKQGNLKWQQKFKFGVRKNLVNCENNPILNEGNMGLFLCQRDELGVHFHILSVQHSAWHIIGSQ
jgi:hypothetical protein